MFDRVRHALARDAVLACSERLRIPAENLVPPAAVRSLAWTPPSPLTTEAVAAQLAAHGARDWQVEQLAARVGDGLAEQRAGGRAERGAPFARSATGTDR